MFGQQFEFAVLMLEEHPHIEARPFVFCAQILFGREGLEIVLGRQGLEVVFGRKRWQNLLQLGEPPIDIFEMCVNHCAVHRPHLHEKKMAASGPPS
jgi:hypothetical protein